MTLTVGIPLLFFVLGLVLYMIARPKWDRVGEILFFAGSLGLCLRAGEIATAFGFRG